MEEGLVLKTVRMDFGKRPKALIGQVVAIVRGKHLLVWQIQITNQNRGSIIIAIQNR
jgi:hypothetical protein